MEDSLPPAFALFILFILLLILKMQELTKLDVERLHNYQVDIDPIPLYPNYPHYTHRPHSTIPYQETHRHPTTSSINDITQHHLSFHSHSHSQHPVTLVQSISVPSPSPHQRRSSCILSVREIKELKSSNDTGCSRRSLQSKGRKIFVSIAKSNCKEKQAIELGGTSDTRKKITLTKYINYRSNQKGEHPC